MALLCDNSHRHFDPLLVTRLRGHARAIASARYPTQFCKRLATALALHVQELGIELVASQVMDLAPALDRQHRRRHPPLMSEFLE
eukprot:6088454-Amphidinium_carterae.1